MARSICVDVALLWRVQDFNPLPEEVLSALAVLAVERRYNRGQAIFLEGEPCAGLYVVARGEAKVFKVSPQGRGASPGPARAGRHLQRCSCVGRRSESRQRDGNQ